MDVGCGGKPYRSCFSLATEYKGLDVVPGPAVDVVVARDKQWPLPSEYFDVLLSSQMLQFASDLDLTLGEMKRVLKHGGTAVLTFPFIYNEYTAPYDLQRFSVYRAAQMFSGYDVHIERQGGIGSTLCILLLNWIEMSLNRSFPTRLFKAFMLPLWMALSLALNTLGLLVDYLDRTDAFYSNVLIVAHKP